MSGNIHLLCVGKLKNKNLQGLEDDYLVRIKNPKLVIHEVKASSTSIDAESDELIRKIESICPLSKAYIILLSERGKLRDSVQFSKWIYNIIEKQHNEIFFVIGGALGHGQKMLSAAAEEISLSPLTFPHQIARALFVEQYYRAQTIKNGHPYHNPDPHAP